MASPKRPALSSTLVLLLVLAMAEQSGVVAVNLDANVNFIRHFPPLLDCSPATSSSKDDGAYRADVLSVLRALPAAAAAAPTGFAAIRSRGAFARGLCFGSSSPGDCLACLSAAAEDAIAGRCARRSRRAGVWRAGCFLSYADTNASSAREDAFRGWFYDGGGRASVALVRQCAGDRAAAECARCLNASELVVSALNKTKLQQRPSRSYGDAVVVVGYDCYLRVRMYDLLPLETWCVILFITDFLMLLCTILIWARRAMPLYMDADLPIDLA